MSTKTRLCVQSLVKTEWWLLFGSPQNHRIEQTLEQCLCLNLINVQLKSEILVHI